MSFGPINAQLQTLYATSPPPPQPPSQHSSGEPPFDSSMALTILVLLSALFFMGFFSIYIRRFSTDPSPELTLSNNRPRPPRPAVSLKHKGIDPEVIRALPVYSYYRGEEIECAICLGEFEEKENVRMIPYCRHVFHLECIETWLKMHVTCPVCRGTRLFGSSGGGGGVAAAERVVEGGIGEGVRRSTVENGDTCIDIGEVRLLRV
ncbi:RING/U-box superfamily protein [Euphorbia peplus]|nr:RING/U-box superfamily protein [Euphorbia peplus]